MPSNINDFPSRAALRGKRRVLVKAGTSVMENTDGRPSLIHLAAIVEQLSELNRSGVEVIFVSSGSVGMGKRLLRKQGRTDKGLQCNQTNGTEPRADSNGAPEKSKQIILHSASHDVTPNSYSERKKNYDSACAAAGQFEMMNLYTSLFNQCDVSASQVLLTQSDLQDPLRISNLKYNVDSLLSLGIIPIINEKIAISTNAGITTVDLCSDIDSLAAQCARSFGVEVCLLLTDVDGVYDRPPSEKDSKLLPFFKTDTNVSFGENICQEGYYGMAAKIDAAKSAVAPGSSCGACVIASGKDLNCIRSVLSREYVLDDGGSKGTLFATPGSDIDAIANAEIVSKEAQDEVFKIRMAEEATKNAAVINRNAAHANSQYHTKVYLKLFRNGNKDATDCKTTIQGETKRGSQARCVWCSRDSNIVHKTQLICKECNLGFCDERTSRGCWMNHVALDGPPPKKPRALKRAKTMNGDGVITYSKS